jgi:hypothetical protein
VIWPWLKGFAEVVCSSETSRHCSQRHPIAFPTSSILHSFTNEMHFISFFTLSAIIPAILAMPFPVDSPATRAIIDGDANNVVEASSPELFDVLEELDYSDKL